MSDMDNIFRKKLFDHESELPGGMWDNIEAQLKKEKKNRLLPIFLLFGVGLLLGLGFIFINPFGSSNKSDETITEQPAPVSETSLATEEIESPEIIRQEAKLSLPSYDEVSAEKITIRPRKEINIDNEKIFISLTEDKSGQEEMTSATSDFKISATSLKKEKTQKNTFVNLSGIEKLLIEELNIAQRSFKDPIGCPSFSNRRDLIVFVEGYFTPFYAYNALTSNSPEIGDSYLTLRRESESPLLSWAAGFNVGWISDYNVGVKAGLEYEVINERFTYEDPEAIRNQTVITIDTMFNTDGTFTTSSDTSIVQVAGTEVQRIANSHRTWSIPVQAVYHIALDQYAFEISGGPIFNLSYANRGKIVDPSNNDQWFTKGESGSYDVYRNRLSVSFTLSVSAMFNVSEHLQVFARPTFKFHPISIARNDAVFSQKYLNTGAAVGVRYYFSGNPNF